LSNTLKCDNGDLMVATAGRFLVVTGIEKCAQDMAESLLNNWDPNELMWYNGSELFLIDADPSSLDAISAEERIRVAVEKAIDRLIDLQEDDNYVDPDEKIEEIRELWVRSLGKSSYGFFLRVVTESEENVPLGFSIELSQQLPSSLETQDLLNFITTPESNVTYL
jgi:hypothetical protein